MVISFILIAFSSATQDITTNTDLGIYQVYDDRLTDNYIRVKANQDDTSNYPFSSIEDVRLEKLENNVVISKLI